jgi:hypothetical protein
MIAQVLNFCVATKGVMDDAEGDRWKFWEKWLSGECLIYFGEILLLVVFMMATPEFPYSYKPLWKEDISAITMIFLSAMTILVLNSLWFYGMFWKAIDKIKEIKTTAAAYREKAIQNWEYAKSVYTVCKERFHIMTGNDAKKKREVREEVYAGFKQQLHEACPWIETVQRLREQYAPQWMQDPDDGGRCGDMHIAGVMILVGVIGYGIFKILHHHAVKAIHHGIHHVAKHGGEYLDAGEHVVDGAKGGEKKLL